MSIAKQQDVYLKTRDGYKFARVARAPEGGHSPDESVKIIRITAGEAAAAMSFEDFKQMLLDTDQEFVIELVEDALQNSDIPLTPSLFHPGSSNKRAALVTININIGKR